MFSVFAWNYVGLQPSFKVIPVCGNAQLQNELIDVLQEADSVSAETQLEASEWTALEEKQISLWQAEKARYLESVKDTANYKLESIASNYRNQKRSLEQKISDAVDSNVVRIYTGMLRNATEQYNAKVEKIKLDISRADIYTSLVANGVLEVRR